MNKKVLLSVLSFIYIIVLLFGSFILKPNSVMPDSKFDLVFHVLGFLVLALLLFFTLVFYNVKNKLLLLTFLSALVISVVVELLRIPGRGFSFADLAFDIIGIIIGLLLTWSFFKH